MKRAIALGSFLFTVGSMGVGTARAATAWDEATKGDLSNDGLSPTAVVVGLGSNRVLGTTGNSGQGIDRDYFKLTVPTGMALTSIQLLSNTAVSGGVSFIGMQAGPQLTVTPSGGGSENLIAWGHYGNDLIGTDLLPLIELTAAHPLPSGVYSVWVQDTGGPASYGFDFVLSAVATAATPAPALPPWAALLLAGSLALGFFVTAGQSRKRLGFA